MMSSEFCITLTTTNNEENKQQLVEVALANGLAACVQTIPIESHYVWQGKVCCDQETLLVMKTTKACYTELEQAIVANHHYEVPQVIQVPLTAGFNPYLAWIEENTRC